MDFKNHSKNKDKETRLSFWKRLGNAVQDIVDSLSFSNCISMILNEVESKNDIVTAVVSMKIERNRFDNKISFDLIHTDKEGRAYRTKDFYKTTLPAASLPQYISEQLVDDHIFRVNFSLEDLTTFYNETEIHIDEKESFDGIIDVAKQNNTAKIVLIDRVFYTRIECFDTQEHNIGVFHIGILNNLPKEISDMLYPGGQAEYVLQ